MPWSEWLDLDNIKAVTQHTSVVAAVVVCYKLIFVLVRWGVEKGALRTVLHGLEGMVLVGLFLWFIIQMGLVLWERRVRNGPAACFLVA